MRFLFTVTQMLIATAGFGLCFCLLIISGLALYIGPQLPHIQSINDMRLQTPLRVYSADMKLIGEFGETRRQPLAYTDIPPLFVKAVLAAEDDRFFSHGGVDATGMLRAAKELVTTGHIQSGGSTITMQLARNFFLSAEKSFIRKFKEVLLSLQMERSLSKQQIFELYSNKIYLGNHAYGVQAAAFIYYGKALHELSIAEWAMLAGLPKAPSKFNPIANPSRALERRNWIIGRMLQLGYITKIQHDAALAEPVTARYHGLQVDIDAPFVAEMGRQFAVDKFGPSAYIDGYNVYTTIDSRLQLAAQKAVWDGVTRYAQNHGFRGVEAHLDPPEQSANRDEWRALLIDKRKIGDLDPAIVVSANKQTLKALLPNGKAVDLIWNDAVAKSLRPYKNENYIGEAPSGFSTVFKAGDIIRLQIKEDGSANISQIPRVQAALVALTPDTGALIALAGGSDFNYSKFNRVTQALRQPGSSFKPFIYTRALEKGYTAATLINDAPLVFHEAGMAEPWRPANSDDKYLGPIRLRQALYQSRNMVSIRILQDLRVRSTIASLARFGFDTSKMEPNLSLALGSHALPPMAIANAFAILANGGYKVDAFWVDRIEDSQGKIAYQHPPLMACNDCPIETPDTERAPRVVDEQTDYIITDILKDVVRKGTGRPALALKRPDIAGKTGTNNGPTDVWFSGFNPTVSATAWVGFDDNTPLGKREYGGTVALPIWMDFMRTALQDTPVIERPMPPGLVTIRINPKTGLRASPNDDNAIFEIFHSEKMPHNSLPNSETTTPSSTPLPESAVPSLTEDIF